VIKRISQLTREEIVQSATLVVSNRAFCQHFFPGCETNEQVSDILSTACREWRVIVRDVGLIALFSLATSRTLNKCDRVCIKPSSVDAVASEMSNLSPETLTIILAPPELEKTLSNFGFEQSGLEVKLSKKPQESRTMQLLPLSNPVEKDIPELSRLMSVAYACSNKYPDATVAEMTLRGIISEKQAFLQSSSFISRAGDKIVSACLATEEYGGAVVSELFTDPLYRARGLATTELMMCMNMLARTRIPLLRVAVEEKNEVTIRLLLKLGFAEDLRMTIMVRKIIS